MEEPGGYNATPDGLKNVTAAAQSIAWEDWIPVEGGAQFAQGKENLPACSLLVVRELNSLYV